MSCNRSGRCATSRARGRRKERAHPCKNRKDEPSTRQKRGVIPLLPSPRNQKRYSFTQAHNPSAQLAEYRSPVPNYYRSAAHQNKWFIVPVTTTTPTIRFDVGGAKCFLKKHLWVMFGVRIPRV